MSDENRGSQTESGEENPPKSRTPSPSISPLAKRKNFNPFSFDKQETKHEKTIKNISLPPTIIEENEKESPLINRDQAKKATLKISKPRKYINRMVTKNDFNAEKIFLSIILQDDELNMKMAENIYFLMMKGHLDPFSIFSHIPLDIINEIANKLLHKNSEILFHAQRNIKIKRIELSVRNVLNFINLEPTYKLYAQSMDFYPVEDQTKLKEDRSLYFKDSKKIKISNRIIIGM